MGALSAVAATACFTELARGHFGAHAARLGTIWFGAGSATLLFTNRLPFALGTAFALAAALALQRDRPVLAPLLGALSAVSSPVAGLFAGMAGLAYAIAARGEGVPIKRRAGLALAAGSVLPPIALSLAFPEGGYAPFPFSSYLPIPLFARHGADRAAALRAHPAGGGRAVRGGVDAGAGDPHGDGRQRRPHGGTDRRAAAGVCARRPRRLAPAGGADRGGAGRARVLAVVARCARHLQGGHRPGGQGLLLRPRARVPAPAPRPAPRGDPVHARALGGGRGGLRGAAGAGLAAPARHRPPPHLLQGRHQRADLRQLADRERRPLRGGAGRQARPQLLPRDRADRARASLPAAQAALRPLGDLRGDPAHAHRDPRGRRQHHARAAALGRAAAAGAKAGRGARARALDALLAGQGRLRGARRGLDACDGRRGGLPAPGHPLRAGARGAARPPL